MAAGECSSLQVARDAVGMDPANRGKMHGAVRATCKEERRITTLLC